MNDDERQPHDVITSDTENATQIRPSDASPGNKEKAKRFRDYNMGLWNGPKRENTEEFRRQDDLHRYDALASSLSLTQYQKARGRKILDDFDAHTFGLSIDHIIFGICVVVANADVNDGTRYWPGPEKSCLFSRVGESIDLTWKEQMSAIKKVMVRVDV